MISESRKQHVAGGKRVNQFQDRMFAAPGKSWDKRNNDQRPVL